MYDICIIGAGIAGLYCAREIQKKMLDAKICILEKFKNIGGRIYTFHTTE
jgi:flavin-dependent dehydrogenase